MIDIAQNLTNIKQHISGSEIRYGRPPHSVTLLAVSKAVSLEDIEIAIQAGQLLFGESYLQEALPKINALANKNLEWHFIGPIQNNKTKKIAENFSWVHSVCTAKTAQRLNDQRPKNLPPLNICIEMNLSQAASKSGITLDELLPLASICTKLPNLRLRGLMTVPPPQNNFIEQRLDYKKLKLASEFLKEKGYLCDTLSMGMSNDLDAAIAEGSTMVRIGTKIFGQR